jgi:hypothetical protein
MFERSSWKFKYKKIIRIIHETGFYLTMFMVHICKLILIVYYIYVIRLPLLGQCEINFLAPLQGEYEQEILYWARQSETRDTKTTSFFSHLHEIFRTCWACSATDVHFFMNTQSAMYQKNYDAGLVDLNSSFFPTLIFLYSSSTARSTGKE